jgi:hypothetical protein
MKNIINTMRNRVRSIATTVQTTIENNKAEGYVDSGVKILIAVVIGALLLAGLYTLFNTNIIPTLSTKISGLFNYSGN